MSMRGFMRAIRHWGLAARHGVGGDMFGWGTVAAALILGYAHQQYGFITASEQASWWFMPLASAFAGLVVVAVFNALVLAPYRARRMLKPFRIEVVSGRLDGEYPKEAFARQSAAVVMKNLSYRQRSIIRIGVPEADAIVIHCRVWADDNNLRAALRED